MKNGTFELSVFVESICSSALEKTTYYTLLLKAGLKQIELPQKKSLAQSNLISVLESLNLKLNQNEVQNSKNQAKIEVYSVQKYGRKKLLGECLFKLELTNRRQMRTKFALSCDQNAQLKFSYGYFKIECRAFSQNSSKKSKNYSLMDANMQIQESLFAELGQKSLKQNKSTLPNEIKFEQCVSQLQATSNCLNRQHYNQKLILQQPMISQEQKSKKKQAQKINKLLSLNTTNQLASQNRFDLQIQSQVFEVLVAKQQESIFKSIKTTKKLLSGLSPSRTNLLKNMSFPDFSPFSMAQSGQNFNKIALIRPKMRAQNNQEWQNDDNLANTVPQMIGEVKGNLDYIKLSKLTKLQKKSLQIRNRNMFLLKSNNELLQNQQHLVKKLGDLQQNIKEKEDKFEAQLSLLRRQFKQVQKKLMQKSTQEMLVERQLKQTSSKIQHYEQKIKDLKGQIQLKVKQVQHLKQVINSYEDQRSEKNPIAQVKRQESKMPSLWKQPKFQKNNSGIFKSESIENLRKNKLYAQKGTSHVDISCQLQQNNQQMKGISPLFVQFFTSFRKPNLEINNSDASLQAGRSFKKARNNLKSLKQKEKIEKEPSIQNKSEMFIEI